MTDFDLVIIGSGPCCFGYLLGLQSSPGRMAVISSNSMSYNGERLHPKLHDDKRKIIDNRRDLRYGPTSNFGGLSAAWGGILLVPGREVMQALETIYGKRAVRRSFAAVLSALAGVFRLYVLRAGCFEQIAATDPFDIDENSTFLIAGWRRYAWEQGEIDVGPQINALLRVLRGRLIMKLVSRIEFDAVRRVWNLYSPDGLIGSSTKVVLGAGGIGNLRLLQDVIGFGKLVTYDHVPLQVYCLRIFGAKCLDDFSGSATPLRFLERGAKFISAGYGLDALSTRFLRKMVATRLADMVLPRALMRRLFFVQIWHDSLTYMIGPDGPISFANMGSRRSLLPFVLGLFRKGLLPLMARVTPPGEGFHYVSIADDKGTAPEGIFNAIRLRYGGSIEVLGGVGLSTVMLENPSLTFMADAYAKAAASGFSE